MTALFRKSLSQKAFCALFPENLFHFRTFFPATPRQKRVFCQIRQWYLANPRSPICVAGSNQRVCLYFSNKIFCNTIDKSPGCLYSFRFDGFISILMERSEERVLSSLGVDWLTSRPPVQVSGMVRSRDSKFEQIKKRLVFKVF